MSIPTDLCRSHLSDAPMLIAEFARRWLGSVLGGLLVIGWLWTLGSRSLFSPDEGRYAVLALAMAESGDWVTPRLNGLLYFEKPPLQYWLGAVAFKLFGVSAFSARLWPGLSGLLTVALLGGTAWRLWGREAGLRAGWMAVGTTWIVVNSHFLSLDAGLMAMLTWVLCSVLLAEQPGISPQQQRRWMCLAWFGLALAVLSKGLIGLIVPGAMLVLGSVLLRDASIWRRLQWGWGGLIFLGLVVPWFVLMAQRHPDFAHFFFIHEHVERYLSSSHRREGAWWYFIPVLLLGFMPWTSALLGLLRRTGPQPKATARALIWLRVWALFILVFFSCSGSKLPSYILPMFPALVLLMAERLQLVSPSSWRWHVLLPGLGGLVVLLASFWLERHGLGRLGQATALSAETLAHLAAGARWAGALLMAAAIGAWWALGRQQLTVALAMLALGQFCAVSVLLDRYEAYGQFKSAARMAQTPAVQAVLQADPTVYAVRLYDQSLPFYLRRNVVLVDYVSEFEFGQQQEPQRWIPSLETFVDRWRGTDAAALAFMAPSTLQLLQQRQVPLRVLFDDGLRVLVTKPVP
ncbi:MAG: glycosyltransferase family 39 protein [Leptothrix ochracea]|uniref:glycosyltransferase family 39 protein n=1 Tax=Leptothrix ochracea TaxID=735331 RepID=UPI0034E2F71D